jgi:hypothetical protein
MAHGNMAYSAKIAFAQISLALRPEKFIGKALDSTQIFRYSIRIHPDMPFRRKGGDAHE